jgi:integrase/recombinase XerD
LRPSGRAARITDARGGPLKILQQHEMPGHADISTMQIHTHVDRSFLRQEHESFHPRG